MDSSKFGITYAISQNFPDYDVRASSEITNELKILIRERKYMDVATNLNMVKPFIIVFPIDVLNDIKSMKRYEGGISFLKIVNYIKINLKNSLLNDVDLLLIPASVY